MRDLFQVVFELKKKEIEDAKTMLENKEQQQQVQKTKVNTKYFTFFIMIDWNYIGWIKNKNHACVRQRYCHVRIINKKLIHILRVL